MSEFPDWQPAPNIRDAPDVYELENEALDPGGAVWSALREAADWEGRTLVDLGCGTGLWPALVAEICSRGVGPRPRRLHLGEARAHHERASAALRRAS